MQSAPFPLPRLSALADLAGIRDPHDGSRIIPRDRYRVRLALPHATITLTIYAASPAHAERDARARLASHPIQCARVTRITGNPSNA